ncbi:unnamed protein product [Caenorhabditis brenneri]
MGAYLNRPIIEKEKEEGVGDGFSYACTTMQGWRASQEDAHNCVVDLHTGWHMFAVYDGHGGTEVSKFTSAKLPEFLRERKFWESDDVGSCLQKAFVDFDDFIRAEDSMKELKLLSGDGKGKQKSADDSEDEADRIDTIEESAIPIAELIKRYGGAGGGKALLSAFLERGDASDSDEDEEEEEEDEEQEEGEEEEEKNDEANVEEGNDENKTEDAKEEPDSEADKVDKKEPADEKTESKKVKVQKRCSKSPILSEAKKSKSDESEAAPASSSSLDQEKTVEDDEEDSDKEFVADEEEEADEEQSDEEMEETDFSQFMLGGGGAEVPGEDSGTTACVCLIGSNKVIVANAGDSRAVLCRAGKAVDLSVDHKPEDEIETNRIHAAGGTIEDGRVNGGLNLSRAFGDHAYKKNHELELKEQMITAHPDIKIEDLTEDDEFLIVACDGIWNSMESQQVVDFVRDLIGKGKSCAEICDALCDECLAESTDGDGTGCDNMTVICTIFKR